MEDFKSVKTAELIKRARAVRDPDAAAELGNDFMYVCSERLASIKNNAFFDSARYHAHTNDAARVAAHDEDDPRVSEHKAQAEAHRREFRKKNEMIEELQAAIEHIRPLLALGVAGVRELREFAGKYRAELSGLTSIKPKNRTTADKNRIALLKYFIYYSEIKYLRAELAAVLGAIESTESAYSASREG